MWVWIALGLFGCVAVTAMIHFWLQRNLQQRALQALRWIENSLGTAGHVSGMRWLSDSKFEVPLKVVHPVFHRAYIEVNLPPRKFLRQREPATLTFHSDLDHAPGFSMAFENLRWFARTDKNLSSDAPGWQVISSAPVVLTTRLDWERDVTSAIYTVLHTERREHVNVTFRRSSPNFSATFPLDSLAPEASEPFEFLTVLREMAEGVSLKKAS
ncbi:MAG TPA: hypothetical protein VMZ25_06590 [Terriglobales bacterium]|nr:hypothetical protein [Terriglobales bacterium]